MHFDELMVLLGVGAVQCATTFCCSFLVFLEGFLPSGLFFILPGIVCDYGMASSELVASFIPYLTGMAAGTLSITMTSDVNGRRATLCTAGMLGFFALLFAATSTTLIAFEISTFLAGVSMAALSSGCRLLIFETAHMKLRGCLVVVLDILWSSGVLAGIAFAHVYVGTQAKTTFDKLYGLAILGPPWRVHLLLCAILALFGTIAASAAAFSPRQMFAHQRIVTAHSVLRRFFAANKREHENNFLSVTGYPPEVYTYVENRQVPRNSGIVFFSINCVFSYVADVFRFPFTISSIVLIAVNIIITDATILLIAFIGGRLMLGRDGILTAGSAISSSAADALCKSGTSPSYIVHMYLAFAVVVATVVATPLIDFCPRPIILSLSGCFGAAASTLLLFGVNSSADWASACAIIFFHTLAVLTLNIITMECFPTKFRATAFGVTKAAARLLLIAVLLLKNTPISQIFPPAMFCASVLALCLNNMNGKRILE